MCFKNPHQTQKIFSTCAPLLKDRVTSGNTNFVLTGYFILWIKIQFPKQTRYNSVEAENNIKTRMKKTRRY